MRMGHHTLFNRRQGQGARTRLSSSMRAAEVMSVPGRTTRGASVITSPTLEQQHNNPTLRQAYQQ